MAKSIAHEDIVRQEVTEIARTVADLQARLDKLLNRIDDNDDAVELVRKRCRELEKENTQLANSAKWLGNHNEELQRQLSEQAPAIDQVLDARNAAFTKLKHARKVIRDLLVERGDLGSPALGRITEREIEAALLDREEESSSEESSPDSDKTVRLAPMSPFSPVKTGKWKTKSPPVSSPVYSNPSTTSGLSTINLSPEPATVSPPRQQLKIHFKKPPGSAIVHNMSFSWDEIQHLFGFSRNDDKMAYLRSLASPTPDFHSSLQFHLFKRTFGGRKYTITFLYDPILMDSREMRKSYVLNFGTAEANQSGEERIQQMTSIQPYAHTFTFPVEEQRWYYIGAQYWSTTEVSEIWPTLKDTEKRKILKKLSEKAGSTDMEEIKQRLDSGDLEQFCVELMGVEDRSVTDEFMQTILGKPPMPAQPR